MSEIQSGRELCSQFFENLKGREDIDQKVVTLLQDLFSKGKLTGGQVLDGLKALRMVKEDETGS
jgi:hypothetical protein